MASDLARAKVNILSWAGRKLEFCPFLAVNRSTPRRGITASHDSIFYIELQFFLSLFWLLMIHPVRPRSNCKLIRAAKRIFEFFFSRVQLVASPRPKTTFRSRFWECFFTLQHSLKLYTQYSDFFKLFSFVWLRRKNGFSHFTYLAPDSSPRRGTVPFFSLRSNHVFLLVYVCFTFSFSFQHWPWSIHWSALDDWDLGSLLPWFVSISLKALLRYRSVIGLKLIWYILT